MDLSKQSQTATDGSTAIQSQGSVTINQGMSPAQMAEVMLQLMDATRRFTDEAMAKVDARQAEFQEAILKQFTDKEKADSDAFRDPDFQYTLGRAQQAFVRSGDQSVKETLADIIARRSKAQEGTRLALTLNDAAIRAASLTIEEFATLSLVYLTRYTVNRGIRGIAAFEAYVRDHLMPFVPNASGEESSFWHIEAQNCGRIATGEVGLRAVWVHNYGGVLGHGLPLEQAQGVVDPTHASLVEATLIPCLRDNSMFQPNAISQEMYLDTFKSSAIPEA